MGPPLVCRDGGVALSISFGLAADGPPWRARALLALVRPYVDEVVVAGDEATVAACAGLADVAVVAVSGAGGEALLRALATADWLLLCEGWDVPGRALLEALGELAGERALTAYALPRRWLWRDRDSFVVSSPWLPDYRPRVVRRGAPVPGEQRLVDLPLYSAQLLVADEAQRRVRALALERRTAAVLCEGAPPGAVLVPEDWERLELQAVAQEDRAAVACLLDEAAPVPVPVAAPAADGARPRRTPAPDAAAAIAFPRPVARMSARTSRRHEVLVRNDGDVPWPWHPDGEAPLRLGYRWLAGGRGGAVLAEGPRTRFTETVAPGATSLVCLDVEAPPAAGRYVLEVDVVEEHVRWLGCAARVDVEVEDPYARPPRAPTGRRAFLAQAREHRLGPRDALREQRRWAPTQRPEATPLSDGRPWLTFAAADELERALPAGARVCEYGCGGSTRFALARGADVVTIECDADWAARVEAALTAAERARWRPAVVAPEPDAAAAPLDASDPGAHVSAAAAFQNFSFGAYVRAIDRFDDGCFDVVLVAGRARPSCLRHALRKVVAGGLLILDHSERPWYGPALALAATPEWERRDHAGPGPYAERFWQTTILRRSS